MKSDVVTEQEEKIMSVPDYFPQISWLAKLIWTTKLRQVSGK
jgi:hypothetical protein